VAERTRTARVGIALIIVGLIVIAGVGADYLSPVPKGVSSSSSTSGSTGSSTSSSSTSKTLIASSPGGLFVGAVGGDGYLYVGLLNGSIEKMNPWTGQVLARLALPDRNSAAHLLFYNGSLYVGTESLRGAKNVPPFHIYRVDPQTMQILTQVRMNLNEANGFVFAYNGYLWAGDGACTLYEIKPDTLSVIYTVLGAAEDEMVYDGTYYWTECRSSVNVLKADSALPTIVANGTLPFYGRARGFFEIGSAVYATDGANFTLYRMSISGNRVVFKSMGTLGNHTLGTRDTFSMNGMLYTYQTRDDARVQARIFVYDRNLRLKATITLTGYGLSTDASQHSMLLFDGRIFFVTTSSIGYFVPSNAEIRAEIGRRL